MEVLVGHLGLGHRRFAPQGQDGGVAVLAAGQGLEAAVDLGVDPADEERGDAGHVGELGRPAGRHQRLEAADVGLHHLVVAVEPEDQRDVDAASLADQGVDGRHALLGRRHLDQQVRLGDAGVQLAGVAHRGVGVVRQGGGDLQGDVAVLAVAVVVERDAAAPARSGCR